MRARSVGRDPTPAAAPAMVKKVNKLKFLAILCLAPLAELLSLSLFIFYFMFPNTEKQVEWNIYSKSAPNIFFLV